MSSAVRVASQFQIGKESTRGTLVAASRRMMSIGTVRRNITQHKFENQINGSLSRTTRAPLITAAGTILRYEAEFTFEEILFGLLGGMKGGVTGTGAGADKTWTFTPGDSADPAPDTYTVEWVESDLSNQYEMEAGYGLVTGFEVKAEADGVPTLAIDVVARDETESTRTSLSLPTVNYAANALWSVYFDSTWAGLGGTQKTGQVYAFRYKFNSGLRLARYLDGRSTKDASKYEFGPRWAELELDTVIDAASGSVARDEIANRDAGTMRFVQLKLAGASLGASNYECKLDGAYYHDESSLEERGRDRDGNLMATIRLLSAKDATSGNDVQAIVKNALTAFPA